ncbi:phenylalanine ammonia-lyase [Puccinia sorghi]|uniref:Phenylalanine ammonia-lyase n=1 Tax=Puccinia sorghi TaxID=27349 RepID=A0A0L6VHV3_9BASI|nr:phenylalanine ammonia-lyase [Puccinia sorghi]
MANYLGGTQLLYRVLVVSIGIPVQQGDVAEGIKSPSMGGITYRMYCLLQWGCLMPDHHQEDLGDFSTPAAKKIWPIPPLAPILNILALVPNLSFVRSRVAMVYMPVQINGGISLHKTTLADLHISWQVGKANVRPHISGPTCIIEGGSGFPIVANFE